MVRLLSAINQPINAIFGAAAALMAGVPGWFSLTVLSVLLGAGTAFVFRHAVNRQAFDILLDRIQANILAVYLFHHDLVVTLRAEKQLVICSIKLLRHTALPMLILILPASLLLVQMSAWYQARPVKPGSESAIIQMKIGDAVPKIPEISLADHPAIRVLNGPVRILSRKEVYWEVAALQAGRHTLIFQLGERQWTKLFSAGDGIQPLSPLRPGQDMVDVILYPLEAPFPLDSPIRSIHIAYPPRVSRFSGTNWWLLSLGIISTVVALLCKPFSRSGR